VPEVGVEACGAGVEGAEAAAARQQAKIDARAAEEQASGKPRSGRKPMPAAGRVDPERVANPTDQDSRIKKMRRGWVQRYNAQVVVTPQQIILASEVTTEANDVRQLQPMLDQAQAMVELLLGEDAAAHCATASWSFRRECPMTVPFPAPVATYPTCLSDGDRRREAQVFCAFAHGP
jgi:hypothetical protein